MEREISYEWSRDLVRKGTQRFIKRCAGLSLVFSAVVTVTSILALILGRKEMFWWALIILSIIYVGVWIRYYQSAFEIWDKLPDRNVTVKIQPDSIHFTTGKRSQTMKWSRIRKLWSYPDLILLFTYDRKTYVILPTGPLGEDAKGYIEEQVRENGGKVS